MEGFTYDQILQEILKKTHSELIVFFVILLIILVAVIIPLYAMSLRGRKERLAHENARENQIISVITKNTEVISSLKATLEISGNATSDSLARIHDRIDGQYKNCAECGASLARVQATSDEIVRKLQTIASAIIGTEGE